MSKILGGLTACALTGLAAPGWADAPPSPVRLALSDAETSATPLQGRQGVDESAGSRRKPLPYEEVIVTAQKTDERLQDVPVPVTVISATSLAELSQTRVQDYYTKIPGLSFVPTGNGNAPRITIRGLTTGGSTNPTTGTVIDDVSYGFSVSPQSSPSVPDIDPGDLAHVEVLRGPQGALYGNSSIGGLLKFVTVDPSTERMSGRVQVGTSSVRKGDDLGYNARGALNVPLSDTLAARASAFTDRTPGYVENVQTGQQDINYRDSKGGRLSALWLPSNSFSLKLSALLQESERFGEDQVDLRLGRDEFKRSSLPGTGVYRRDTEAYSATMTGKIGEAQLVSATGYNVDTEKSSVDLTTVLGGLYTRFATTFFGVAAAAQPFDVETEKFSQELRLSLPLGERLQWMVGLYYTDEDIATRADLMAANPSTGRSAGTLLSADTRVKFEEYAAFTNLTVQITDRFDVQLGGRYSENDQSFVTFRSGPLVAPFFGGVTAVPEVDADDSSVTYLVTPRFKVSPDLMVYARFASGYRPGGPNTNCGSAAIPCQFDADTTQNYDLGLKGAFFDHALSVDASVYYIDWKDIQTGIRPGFVAYIANAGRAKSQGAELSVEARPLTGLTISAWAAYNKAELTEIPPSSTLGATEGSRLPYSSPRSGEISVDQEFDIGASNATAFVGGSLSYVDERKGGFRAVGRETFPSYTQFDLRAGVRFDAWTVNALVTNVADKRGVLTGGQDAIAGPTYFTFIQPRTYGVNVSFNY